MNTLKQIQHQLWELITAPEGVHKALQGLDENLLPVTGSNKMTPAERLDIYAQMYFFRLKDALKEDHPALVGVLGEVKFHNLVTDYLLAFPPTSYTLRNLGENLAKFIQDPMLRELVSFERHLVELFDTRDVAVLDLDAAKKIPPEQWGEIKFQTIPALSLENFSYPIDQIFEAAIQGGYHSGVVPHPTQLLLWRPEYKVLYRRIQPEEAGLLQELKTPQIFDDLCAKFAQNQPPETAIHKLAQYLQIWLGEGLLETLQDGVKK